MTSGWLADRPRTHRRLLAYAVLGVVCVVVGLFAGADWGAGLFLVVGGVVELVWTLRDARASTPPRERPPPQ